MKLKDLSNLNKKLILFISDFLIITFSLFASFSLRLEKIYPISEINPWVFIIFLTVFFSVFYFFNIYQILLRYFDNFSIKKIIKAILVFQIIIIVLNFSVFEIIYFPRSISFIAPVIIGMLIILHRIVLNYLITSKNKFFKKNNNILIYGINQTTIEILKNLRQFPDYGNVKAFIDNNDQYKKREINDIKIFKKNSLYQVIKDYSINEIILGPNTLSQKLVEELYLKLENKNIRIVNVNKSEKNFPRFIHRSLETKVQFHDVINRLKIETDKNVSKKNIYNKNILVTGGGGSIGSELCLQLITYNPKNLYIMDISEINLFEIINKIKTKKNIKTKFYPILGDCSDLNYMKKIFFKINIDFVYHAAAYKHVGFGQKNPYAIIKNNIIGTKIIIDFLKLKKIKNFIFVSSDKAVNPKSYLGLTKYFGEIMTSFYFNTIKNKSGIKFTIVRFGNVIGSSGSVIPIFLKQIENNDFLTVTHKKAERYFMSISEAVELIIHSSSLTKGLNIFALDMGEQIKIIDIAKRIIRLSGKTLRNKLNPNGDISIKIVGLSKGEKISEELTLGNKLKKTKHPKILICEDVINDKKANLRYDKIFRLVNSNKINQKILEKLILDN